MSGRSLFASTVRFPDVARGGNTINVTEQDEEMLVRKLPRPTSSVDCSLPTQLVLPSTSPQAIVRRLDVSGAALFVEHAIPNEAAAWLPLVFPAGKQMVPARVVQTLKRSGGDCWIAELKFELVDREARAQVVALLKAIRLDAERKLRARGR